MDDNTDIIKKEPETKAPHWWHERWLLAFEETGNVGRACKVCGISRQTAYKHRELFPDFAVKWDELREQHTDEIEQVAVERALSAKSDVMLIFLLKSRRPEVYRERTGIDLTMVKPPKPLEEMSDEELDAYSASLRGASPS